MEQLTLCLPNVRWNLPSKHISKESATSFKEAQKHYFMRMHGLLIQATSDQVLPQVPETFPAQFPIIIALTPKHPTKGKKNLWYLVLENTSKELRQIYTSFSAAYYRLWACEWGRQVSFISYEFRE